MAVSAIETLTGSTIELSPPASDASHAPIHEAPVIDRSFFDTTEKRLAQGIVTPVDEFSRIPLPILPTKNDLPFKKPEIADWHHPFHPKEHPLLKTTGGLALRNCRVQLVHRNFHNEGPTRYHRFFEGPPIPEDEASQFRTVVLATAGYIPQVAISTRTGEPQTVELSAQQTARLRQTFRKATPADDCKCDDPQRKLAFEYRNLRYSYDRVRHFFSDYVITQPSDHIPQAEVDEFLLSGNPVRQRKLGEQLLAVQVEYATDQLESDYQAARQAKLLHPLMPPSAHEFVKYKLGGRDQRERLLPRLAAQMAVAHGVSGLTIRGQRAIL